MRKYTLRDLKRLYERGAPMILILFLILPFAIVASAAGLKL
nr:MAG TPA: hypothetical protein [Bacteriophage sp.]